MSSPRFDRISLEYASIVTVSAQPARGHIQPQGYRLIRRVLTHQPNSYGHSCCLPEIEDMTPACGWTRQQPLLVISDSKIMICVSFISAALRVVILISSLQHKKDALYGGHNRASATNPVLNRSTKFF